MQRLHRAPRVLPELQGHDILGGLAANVGRAVLGGFNSIVDAIFGTVNNDYVAALPVIDDHSRTLSTLRAELEQMTLQGLARVFTSNATYLASPGTVSADVVLLGAGGGGGTGRWNLLSATRYGGSGGGGGGEIHFSIHGSNLFEANGNPRPIPILVGVGGAGGTANEQAGTGGGNSSFDGIVAYGGQGGASGGGGGAGGYGIVIGGSAAPDFDTPDSLSSFGLYGGGGAGGRGATASSGMTAGGRGGLNAGGGVGQNAPAVSRSTTTGGGGGGGGGAQQSGGHGAAPGGGGGGGGGGSGSSNFGKGGSGANAIAYVIERRV